MHLDTALGHYGDVLISRCKGPQQEAIEMPGSALFRWHEHARLFAGDIQAARAINADEHIFRQIAPQPTYTALSNLGAAITGSDSFCVCDDVLPPDLQIKADDFLTLTGGSSGHPKIICRSQASWIASFQVNADMFAMVTNDSTAVLGKLSHSLALYGVLEALHLGLDAYALDELRPKSQCSAIIKHKITNLYATPTQLRMLTRHAENQCLPSVRLILCGGGDLDSLTQQAAQALCPNAAIHVFYGAAETSFITVSDKNTPIGSVGQRYPGATLRILDTQGEQTKGIGEVWVKSPYLYNGYLSGASEHTKIHNGFVTVGEMGQLDSNGNLWLKGRKTRMIRIADQSVFPEQIEAFIATLPDLGPNAVVPIPDKIRGNRLVAVLQGTEDQKTAAAVQDQCRHKFGALACPTRVLFHPAFPTLPSGKIDLVALTTWLKDQT